MIRVCRLYAELFLHIRVITIHASLSSPDSGKKPTIAIVEDGRSISLVHVDEKLSIPLPTRVHPKNPTTTLAQVSKCGNEYTIRLKLEDELTKEESNSCFNTESIIDVGFGNLAPWTSHCMKNSDSKIMCAQCGSIIQPAGKVKNWLDLPNDDWAELMEFWHCNKPSKNPQLKGRYEKQFSTDNRKFKRTEHFTGNKICVSQGKGFIGTLYFLLHKDDCTGVKVREYISRSSFIFMSLTWAMGNKEEISSTSIQ